MDGFDWKDDYSVGDETLDNQHKKILDLCREINERIDANATNYTNWIFALNHYAQTHFETEEKLIREAGYPDIADHEQGHHIFRAKLSKFQINLMTGNLDIEELRDFVNRWWLDHIRIDDMRYRPYLLAKAKSES